MLRLILLQKAQTQCTATSMIYSINAVEEKQSHRLTCSYYQKQKITVYKVTFSKTKATFT